MENVIVAVILLVLFGGAVAYLIKAKRSGVKCVGCPAGGSCPSSKKIKRKKLAGKAIGRKTIEISGMSCAYCAMSVTESLNQIEGVSAEVDLPKGRAVVSYDREIGDDILKSAVEKAGFGVIAICA